MRHIDPSKLDAMIDGAIVTMKKTFHDDVLSGDVRAQFVLVCTADPVTGAELPNLGLIVVAPASLKDDDEKDSLAITLRMISVAGAAVAALVCMDTWVAIGKDAEDAVKRGVMPREHPNRREAMFVGIECRGRPNVAEYHRYKRLADDVVFEDSDRMNGATMSGRFSGLLPPTPPPPEVVAHIRKLIAMGAAGDMQVVTR
jgi:hypothetical protein